MSKMNLNEKFDEMPAPIDHDALWTKIEGSPKFPRNKDRKNRFFILWFLFFVGVAIGIYYILWQTKETLSSEIIKSSVDLNSTVVTSPEGLKALEHDESNETPISSSTENELVSAFKEKKKGSHDFKNENSNQYASKIDANSSKRILTSIKQEEVSGTKESNKPQEQKMVIEQVLYDDFPPSSVNYLENDFTETSNRMDNVLGMDRKNDHEEILQRLPLIQNLITSSNLHSLQEVSQELLINRSSDKNLVKSKMTITAGIGLGSHIRKYNYLPNGDYEEVFKIESRHSKPLEHYDVFMRLCKTKGKNNFITSVRWRNFYEQMKFQYQDIEYEKSTNLGDLSIYQAFETKASYELYRKISMLNFELGYGRSIEYRKGAFAINTGIIVNKIIVTDGKFIDDQNQVYDLKDLDWYRSDIFPGGFIEIQYQQPVTKQLSINATGRFEGPYRLTNSSQEFQHTILSYGINIGLSYHLSE